MGKENLVTDESGRISSLLQRLRARISPEVKTAFGVILEALFEEPPIKEKKVGGVKRARPAKGRTKQRQRQRHKIDLLKEPFPDTELAAAFAEKASPRARPTRPKPKPKSKSPARKAKHS